jgi:hypothetical protein
MPILHFIPGGIMLNASSSYLLMHRRPSPPSSRFSSIFFSKCQEQRDRVQPRMLDDNP